ncbi:hypothetical protein DVH24_033868, partial [Malus domestica]
PVLAPTNPFAKRSWREPPILTGLLSPSSRVLLARSSFLVVLLSGPPRWSSSSSSVLVTPTGVLAGDAPVALSVGVDGHDLCVAGMGDVLVGTEPLDGLFTINSNPFQMETFENMLVTWRLLQVIENISKYMSLLVASYLAYANQIHVVLAFYIDSIGILTDFGKHFDGDEYVSWCHFNAKYNIDLMAALCMVHTTHIRLMEMYFLDPTTSLPPAQVLPPVFILVLCLVSHFHMLESDHIYLGKGNQVPATDINCMHNWLNGNVLHVGTWFGEAIVFLSLHIWNEILRSHFVLVDPFHHHEEEYLEKEDALVSSPPYRTLEAIIIVVVLRKRLVPNGALNNHFLTKCNLVDEISNLLDSLHQPFLSLKDLDLSINSIAGRIPSCCSLDLVFSDTNTGGKAVVNSEKESSTV